MDFPPESNKNGPDLGWALSRRGVLKGAAVTAGAAAVGAVAAPAVADAADASLIATSPGGSSKISVALTGGKLTWSASYKGLPAVSSSALGVVLSTGATIGTDVSFVSSAQSQVNNAWAPTYGRNATIYDAYQEVRLDVQDNPTGLKLSVQARAYESGVAFRYVLQGTGSTTLADEATTFVLAGGAIVYAARDEDDFVAVSPSAIPVTTPSGLDQGPLTDQPLTATLGSGLALCISEAARLHYPRLMLSSVSGAAQTLRARLMHHPARGSGTAQLTFSVTRPFSTPWRIVVIGATHAQLVDNADLVLNLAPPSTMGDTSWIKPGKALRVTTLTTAAATAGVDFAVARRLQYVEFDAGWYGPEGSTSSDPTKPIAGLNLTSVISYASARHIGVILYVNRIGLTNPASLFALYQQWGVAGLKLGFILDGTQAETDAIINWVALAANHKLLLNLHDDVRPFGQERTYPNWINLEGVRGNEHFPTATHNVTLPFTRNVGGPMDYTICLAQSRDHTTNAHQMAMAAVYYQPLVWLYWYDAPSKYATPANWPQLPWFDAIPTTWDESHTVTGQIGQYIAVARRGGTTWYLGAMTNETSRTLHIPLTFLGSGNWTAKIYADGTPASSPSATPVVVSTATVSSSATLTVRLAPAGGQAVILTRS